MKSFRLRRLAVAAIGAVIAVSGIAVIGVGTAEAAPVTTTVVASSAPTIRAGVANQAAGNETITIQPTYTWVSGDTFTMTVDASDGITAVPFTNNVTVTATSTTGNIVPTFTVTPTAGTNVLTITFTNSGIANAPQPIVVSNIAYTPPAAAPAGGVIVTNSSTGTGTFRTNIQPTATSNAIIAGNVGSAGLNAVTQPTIGSGQNNQPAGNFQLGLSGTNGSGYFAGDKIIIIAAPHSGPNCSGTLAAPVTLAFASAPTATVTDNPAYVSAMPTISSVTLGQSAACTGIANDEVILTLGNSGTFMGTPPPVTNPQSPNQPITISLSGVAYNVSAGVQLTQAGAISVGETYNGATVVAPSTVGPSTGPSDAIVGNVIVTANNPAVGVATNSINQAISNVVITESQTGVVPSGNVCVDLTGVGNTFSTTTTPTVTSSGGGATVGPVTMPTSSELVFPVITPSSTAPATYTLSNISVNASGVPGPSNASVSAGGTSGCNGSDILNGSVTLYNINGSNRIYGQVQDGTAAAELATAYPPSGPHGTCPGFNGGPPLLGGIGVNRPVVLATDQNYPDALSASYLAGQMGTGILVTPTDHISPDAFSALRQEGITSVYVVGGPIAISPADIATLEATPSYTCGGGTIRTSLTGGAQDLTVTQVYGQTQYDTAQAVAQYFGASRVGPGSFAGAYPLTASSAGMYNDTSGSSGSVVTAVPTPAGGLKTAILAVGTNYPDAMSASVMARNQAWPVLLTPQGSLSSQAQSAIVNLGIQQVVVMGGPLAVSDAVLTQLQGLGVSVLRVGGQDYTDTAQLLARFELNAGHSTSGQPEGLAWIPGALGLLISRGDFYTDALAGSVLGEISSSPILLTFDPSTIGTYTTSFLNAYGNPTGPYHTLTQALTFLGGPLAITPATATALQAALAAG